MVVGGDFPTLVWKSEQGDDAGFIQLLLEEDRNHAHILYISPTAQEHEGAETMWLSLLDEAVAEVGQHGVHSLVAEVDEMGPELPLLRQSGFAVYTRQDIWVRETPFIAPSHNGSRRMLRPRRASDDWDIQLLYANTVPRLVQLVEPMPPLGNGEAWVVREQDELEAYVHIHEGPVATWFRFFIHPNAEGDAEEIVTAALEVNPPRAKRPVYCCVRRYEGWLPTALERGGFRAWGSQAVMVKHTVHQPKDPMPKLAAVLEKQGMPVSTPYVQNYETHDE